MDNSTYPLIAYNGNSLLGQAAQIYVTGNSYPGLVTTGYANVQNFPTLPKQPMKLTNEQKVVVDAMKANGETEELMLYILQLGGNMAYQYGQMKQNKGILKHYLAGEPDLEDK